MLKTAISAARSASILFLKANNIAPRIPPIEAVENTVALATGDLTEPAYANWLRSRTPYETLEKPAIML